MGDITYPYTFKISTDYEVILQAKISSDPKYKDTPLTASFDITEVNPNIASLEEIVIYYAIPMGALIGTGFFVLNIRKKKEQKVKVILYIIGIDKSSLIHLLTSTQ